MARTETVPDEPTEIVMHGAYTMALASLKGEPLRFSMKNGTMYPDSPPAAYVLTDMAGKNIVRGEVPICAKIAKQIELKVPAAGVYYFKFNDYGAGTAFTPAKDQRAAFVPEGPRGYTLLRSTWSTSPRARPNPVLCCAPGESWESAIPPGAGSRARRRAGAGVARLQDRLLLHHPGAQGDGRRDVEVRAVPVGPASALFQYPDHPLADFRRPDRAGRSGEAGWSPLTARNLGRQESHAGSALFLNEIMMERTREDITAVLETRFGGLPRSGRGNRVGRQRKTTERPRAIGRRLPRPGRISPTMTRG